MGRWGIGALAFETQELGNPGFLDGSAGDGWADHLLNRLWPDWRRLVRSFLSYSCAQIYALTRTVKLLMPVNVPSAFRMACSPSEQAIRLVKAG